MSREIPNQIITNAGTASADQATLGELIHQRSGDFTPAERKVARTLFATNMMAGFDTVASLAQKAQVSGPTIVRFANKLGFAGYPDFQTALRKDLAARIDSPLSMFRSRSAAPVKPASNGAADPDIIESAREIFLHSLTATFDSLPRAEFDAIVALLADTKRPLWTTGGRFSQACADLLQGHLYQMRPKCRTIPYTTEGRDDALLDLGPRDVLMIFDFRRYQKNTVAFAEMAAAQNVTMILVTDPWLSPVAHVADHVLTTDVKAPSPYDSMVSAMALVELLVAGVLKYMGQGTEKRLGRLEQLRLGAAWHGDGAE